MPNTPCEQDD